MKMTLLLLLLLLLLLMMMVDPFAVTNTARSFCCWCCITIVTIVTISGTVTIRHTGAHCGVAKYIGRRQVWLVQCAQGLHNPISQQRWTCRLGAPRHQLLRLSKHPTERKALICWKQPCNIKPSVAQAIHLVLELSLSQQNQEETH
jgi:hypothetical protein